MPESATVVLGTPTKMTAPPHPTPPRKAQLHSAFKKSWEKSVFILCIQAAETVSEGYDYIASSGSSKKEWSSLVATSELKPCLEIPLVTFRSYDATVLAVLRSTEIVCGAESRE